MSINPIFSPAWTVIAFVFAVVVCIIFGLYPARKAAKLDPVKALRYE
jgi:putative ABC transport system permease protein